MPTKKTISIAGPGGKRQNFKHDSCSTNPGAAKARAVKARKGGKRARVIKQRGLWCVYTRG